ASGRAACASQASCDPATMVSDRLQAETASPILGPARPRVRPWLLPPPLPIPLQSLLHPQSETRVCQSFHPPVTLRLAMPSPERPSTTRVLTQFCVAREASVDVRAIDLRSLIF